MPFTAEGIAYEIRGEGDWLLMINGLGAPREAWALQIDDLSAAYRCIIFDNRGVGESPVTPGPYTTRQLADDAAGLLRALGVPRAHVLGISMGGAIAQELALNYPEMVERLAIVCSWDHSDRYLERCMVILRELVASEGPKGPGWTIPMQRMLSLIAFARDTFADDPKVIKDLEDGVAMAVQAGKESPWQGYVAQANACITHDTRGRLDAIRAPTLILAGAEDAFVPMPLSRALAEAIPNAAWDTMAGCGHVMFCERPADFNQRIIRFLRGN